MEEYKKILQLIYHTPRTGEKPVSALFVGSPGSGKSHLLLKNRSTNCMYLNDVTAAGIETILTKFDRDPEFNYLVIPDLIKPLSRKPGAFISFLNIVTEEGMASIVRKDVNWQTKNGGAHIGIVAAITTDEYRHHLNMLTGMGFNSRVLVLQFNPDLEEIAGKISRGEDDPGVTCQIPKEVLKATICPDAAKLNLAFSTEWAQLDEEEPLRKITLVKRLSKSAAYIRQYQSPETTTIHVEEEDVQYVIDLIKAISWRHVPKQQRSFFDDRKEGAGRNDRDLPSLTRKGSWGSGSGFKKKSSGFHR